MPTTIEDLPYEILSAILQLAAEFNLQDASKYSYGFSGDMSSSRVLGIQPRAQKCPDTLRWITTEAIRQVNRTWHDWACQYSLKSVYLSRWRGSERWLESRTLADPSTHPSGIAVYRDPYCSLKKTDSLFRHYPRLASSVRRIWFDGYHGADTKDLIFSIIRNCDCLQYVTLPWTVLRYGSARDWSYVCGPNRRGKSSIESLELLAVDLKETQTNNAANQVDRKPLLGPLLQSSASASASDGVVVVVDFSNLRRLKIYGNSNFMPITDLDLIQIARTAKNLREIHVTRTTTVTLNRGVKALIEASQSSLELVEYSPLSESESESESESGQEVSRPPLLLNRKAIEALISGGQFADDDSGPCVLDLYLGYQNYLNTRRDKARYVGSITEV